MILTAHIVVAILQVIKAERGPVPELQRTVAAYDCDQPLKIETFPRKDFCLKDKSRRKPKDTGQAEDKASETIPAVILQKSNRATTAGFRCHVQTSEFKLGCMVWSHLKLLDTPRISEATILSPSACRDLITTKHWEGRHKSHPLQIPGVSFITDEDFGKIIPQDSGFTCRGDPTTIHNKRMESVLQISTRRISITREEFSQERGGPLLADTSNQILPCTMEDTNCLTASSTFIWQRPPRQCQMAVIRKAMFSHAGNNTYVDSRQNILLVKGYKTSISAECPNADVYSTQLEGIYFALHTHHEDNQWRKLDDRDVEVFTQILSVAQATLFIMEEKLTNAVNEERVHPLCNVIAAATDNIVNHPFQDKIKIHMTGSTVQLITCRKQLVTLVPTPGKCFLNHPLRNSKFIDPQTRMLISTTTRVPCSKLETTLTNTEGQFLALPSLEQIKPPKRLQTNTIKRIATHTILKTAGTYQQQQINDWQAHLKTASYQRVLLHRLTLGACAHEEECEANQDIGIPPITIDNLIPITHPWSKMKEEIDSLNPLTRVQRYFKEHSLYIVSIFLLIEGIRLIIFLATVTVTLMKEGIKAALALGLRLLFPAIRTFFTFREQIQLARQVKEGDDEGTD